MYLDSVTRPIPEAASAASPAVASCHTPEPEPPGPWHEAHAASRTGWTVSEKRGSSPLAVTNPAESASRVSIRNVAVVRRDQLEAQRHLVTGGDQANDPDRAGIEVGKQDLCRGRDVDLPVTALHGRGELDRPGRLLDRQLAAEGDVVGDAVVDLVRQPHHLGGAEPGQGVAVRLQELLSDPLVAQRLVRRQLFDVDDDLTHLAAHRVRVVDDDVAGDAPRLPGCRPRQAGDVLLDLVADHGLGRIDAVDRLTGTSRQLRGIGNGPVDVHGIQPEVLGVHPTGAGDDHHRQRRSTREHGMSPQHGLRARHHPRNPPKCSRDASLESSARPHPPGGADIEGLSDQHSRDGRVASARWPSTRFVADGDFERRRARR